MARTDDEWKGLGIASIVLVLILVVCYMCVQLFKARRPPACPPAQNQETYVTSSRQWVQYRPSCSGQWLSDRRGSCRGLTTGDMPSIEDVTYVSWAPCGGTLGVPPPVYQ